MNLIAQFLQQAERHAHRSAIIDRRGRAISYAALAEASAALAGAWRAKGVVAGDRVLLAMGLGIDLYVALAAAWRIGAVTVFPEPALGLAGLRHAARTTQPRAFLAAGWYRLLGMVLPELRRTPLKLSPFDQGDGRRDLEATSADHPALISFTSGSSGAPKAIVRSHGFLAAQDACVARLLHPSPAGEIDLVAFPVFVIANLGQGVTSVLPDWNLRRHDDADPAAIAAQLRKHAVTRALVPPSICERLCMLDELPPLKAIFTGGGPVFPDVLKKLAHLAPQADIVAVYGSTEAEPIAHLHVRDIAPADWEAMTSGAGLLAGTPIPEIALQLRDGEIVVTGDHVNKGYLDPAQNVGNKLMLDGVIWHRTGDAGRLDAQGRLWLLGRADGRAAGHYPFSMEVAARSWPGVRRAALVEIAGAAMLAIEGDVAHTAEWRARAGRAGGIGVAAVSAIPLDRRHRSKIDYPALRAMLNQRRNAAV